MLIFLIFATQIRLPYPVNTSANEMTPVISADGKSIYFTSDRKGGMGMEDVWVSRLIGGKWREPVNLSHINTPFSDGAVSVTADERQMYFASSGRAGFGQSDIFVCYKKDRGWSAPQNLGYPVNTPGWESQPSISADGRYLYFISTRPGGFGGTDIWVSKRTEKGWSEPENLGPGVNSPYDEQSPFIAPDGITLYFASNRPGGFGGYDIYRAVKTKDGFTQAQNLGPEINTPYDDICFSVPGRGDIIYIAREEKGNYDIFYMKLPEKMRIERAVTIVAGKLTDKETGKPIKGGKVTIINLETGEKFETVTDESGKYKFALPAGGRYSVSIQADGYLFTSTYLDLKDKKSYEELMEKSVLAPIKKGEKIILRNIFFDFDSYELKPESKYELDRLIRIMKEHKSMVVEIAGHTDDIGTEEYNLRLSQKRAEAVKQYLVEHGIEPQRIIAKGYGKSQPLIADTTEEARALNRRVEFKILKY